MYSGVRMFRNEESKEPRTKRSDNVAMHEHGSYEFDIFQSVLEKRQFHVRGGKIPSFLGSLSPFLLWYEYH